MMRKESIAFKSEDGFIYTAVLWLPECEPKKMLQVVHGMTEHIGRYEQLAIYLTSLGIGLAGFDLRGHGHNNKDSQCAYFNQNDWSMTLKDIHTFHLLLSERFNNTQHILLGFSLGSFLVREYFNLFSHRFSGSIIMGTGHQPKLILSIIIGLVQKEIKKIGYTNTNDFIRSLSFGTYNKKFSPNQTNVDWLCADKEQLNLYINDSLTKNDISARLFYELLSSMKRLTNKNSYQSWDKSMPVLLLSGSDDPVGDFKKGVLNVEKAMKKVGFTRIKCNFYNNARHDLLHEYQSGTTLEVFEDIKEWLEGIE